MKRFVCFLLAMVLVMAMVPAGAVTANAASVRYTSNDAVNILRGSETFYAKEQSGMVGYSTPSSFTGAKDYLNGISKEDAVALMRSYVKKVVDKKINDFTKANNLDLTQKEHDALAVHLYRNDCNDNGLFDTVRKVKTVDSAADRRDIVNAFVDAYVHNVGSDETLRTTLNVSLAEASMYLYGDYGYNGSDKLGYTRLDTDGNLKADDVVGYVKADGYALTAQGTSTFLGWYLYDGSKKTTVGSPITKLTKDHNGKVIVAKQATGGNDKAEYTINTKTLADLHVYDGQLKQTKTILMNNTDLKVTLEYMGSDSIKWVYGTGIDTAGKEAKGWFKIGKVTGAGVPTNKPIATATVNSSVLNVYPGATSDGAAHIHQLNKNDVVNVYEFKTEKTEHGNKSWGKIMVGNIVGWINLVNATVTETKGESGAAAGQAGKIANTDKVNVRADAGTTNAKLTTLAQGTKVTVLQTKMVGDAQWGKIKWSNPSNGYTQGWVYMHYVQLDSAPQGSVTGTPVKPETVIYTGVVSSNINLNVRQYADVYAPKVRSLPNGTKVNVYETAESRNMKWGRIAADQWVCLTYLKLNKVDAPSTSTKPGTETTTELQGTVTSTTLDVLKNYNNNAGKVATLKKGDVVTILEKNTEKTETGSRIWGRISEDGVAGWINLAYVNLKTVTSVNGGSNTTTPTAPVNGIPSVVANCLSVNVRDAAGVYSTQLTKLKNGTAIKVYDEITYDGAPWARITWNNGSDEGWVCMYYVTKNVTSGSAGVTPEGGTVAGTTSNAISATGFVNNHFLNVRSGAGLGAAQLGTLAQGAKVTIFEQIVADGLIWGKITYNNAPAYVCMSYITVENASSTGKGVMGTIARCFAKVNVRSAPGTNNALVSTINVGSRVEVFETRRHANQLWGRVPQGWVCMDYVLLDSELPEGTILDATTAPTTAATTAPTTATEETVNKDGEIAFRIDGVTLQQLNVYNDTTSKSDRVGTINAGEAIDILAIKNHGAELWGRIDQYATAGWINLDKANITFTFHGYVNTDEQPIYVDPSVNSTVKGTLMVNKELYINKVSTDGENVYGWVEESIFGWLPMSKFSAEPVDVIPVYKSGDSVGDPASAIVSGVTFAAMDAYDVIGGSKVLYKMNSGVNVAVEMIRFEKGKIWGLVSTTHGTYVASWIDMSKVNYKLTGTITLDNQYARNTMDANSKITDDPNNIIDVLPAGEIRICQLAFDGYGNLWARVTDNSDARFNGAFVMIMSAAQGVEGEIYVHTVVTP